MKPRLLLLGQEGPGVGHHHPLAVVEQPLLPQRPALDAEPGAALDGEEGHRHQGQVRRGGQLGFWRGILGRNVNQKFTNGIPKRAL